MYELEHLRHNHVKNSAECIEVLRSAEPFEFIVFVIPPEKTEKATKNAMYQRMWKLRFQGFDAMVRKTTEHGYVLIGRRF